LILGDIHAGGGATVDLYFDAETGLVTEEKTLSGGAKHSCSFPLEEFEADMYGAAGDEFMDKIYEEG
jgi:hypothetical protein